MRPLVLIARILVGSLFIVSGLIKANDTLGFSYKLVEYFEPGVLNLEFLIPLALPLAFLICLVEIVLGALVLFGYRMKLSAWLLLGMIVFFTFLTFYSAYFNKVTDCGCFGDAIKLTPWESFYKDVVLLVFILIIFIARNKVEENSVVQDKIILPISLVLIVLFSLGMLGWSFPWIFTIILFAGYVAAKYGLKLQSDIPAIAWVKIVTIAFAAHTLYYLPIKDFRPYAVGKSIPEGMKSAEELGLEAPEYATDYKLKKKGGSEEQTVRSDVYMQNKMWESWDFVEAVGQPYKVKDGYEPPIHDFGIMSVDGEDVTQKLLSESNPSFFVIFYDINKADESASEDLNALVAEAKTKGVKVYALSASPIDEISEYKFRNKSYLEFYQADAIVLKTIIRSNPGLMLMKNGVIQGKWPATDLPTLTEALAELK
ncbi:DoxX family protein [Luteibaculum oceani]|uniref:DoxX family protein n=1 Tax=Luteibaculum oceani TaxID=1294296 RepID=A0A5C6V1U7_9FLAO|nr:DoxX family protein [Luteibaculum oceani]TXC76975.1 DoxX family protein [Luteibaculum oceani]